MNKLAFDVPQKLMPFLESRKMYQILYGGRSSAKTYTALLKLIMRALEKSNQKILCTREYQSSIRDSTHADLKKIIIERKLDHLFDITERTIRCYNGTEFIFKGLARNITGVKSTGSINVCLVEEAETIGADLWDILDPTLRENNCELIVLFNPRESTSATYQYWIMHKIPENDILRIEINYPDNPFNSPVILSKIARMKENDYPKYEHVYLGKVMDMSEDVIFKGKFKILDLGFEESNELFYKDKAALGRREPVYFLHGMDFGFSQDPMALIEVCFPDDDTIYIHREYFEHKLIIPEYYGKVKENFGDLGLGAKWKADESRPDSIAQLRTKNKEGEWLDTVAAPKGKGSVESGVEYLRGKKIIVHPRCVNFAFECFNYKYEKDKNTGTITRKIIDKHNHGWDALRYALCEQIAASLREPMKVNPAVWQQLGIY